MKAPVAMFVYNRVDNTQKTIEHLLANTQARETDLFVFSDGGKNEESWKMVNEVRGYLHKIKEEVDASHALKSITLIERPENIYLERNITEGIAQVFETYDRIIVLEDDICTSPYFLQYMNEAFEMYANTPEVMHIAGFTHLDLRSEGIPFYFTQHMSGWGWGTWRNRWKEHFVHFKSRQEALEGLSEKDIDNIQYGGNFPCLGSLDKNPIPWDVCWEIAIYKAGGICLSPGYTLVRNVGLKNGTHFKAFDILQYYSYDREPASKPLKLTFIEHPSKDEHIEHLFAEAIKDWGIIYTPLGKVVRKIYKLFH